MTYYWIIVNKEQRAIFKEIYFDIESAKKALEMLKSDKWVIERRVKFD